MTSYLIYNISIDEIVRDCKKSIYLEKGVQRRIIIIPNHSDSHSKLFKRLNEEGIISSIDSSNPLPPIEKTPEFYKECYVIDFRQINS